MPTTVATLLVGAGLLLILAGLFGGGLEVKEIKIPIIATTGRVLAFVVGMVLIGLGLYPEMGSQLSNGLTADTPEIEVDESTVDRIEMPGLTGLTEDEARQKLQSSGAALGNVSTRHVWKAHGRVDSQSLQEGEPLDKGRAVDIVLADAVFQFRAERRVVNKDETITASSAYIVKRIGQSENGADDIGEFIVTSLDVRPSESRVDRVVADLIDAPGYVSLDDVEKMDLMAGWEALADVQQEIGGAVAEMQVKEEEGALKEFGTAIWLMLVQLEMEFDIRSMFTDPISRELGNGQRRTLQAGTEMQSTIVLEGPGTVTAAGQEVAFKVMRKGPNENQYRSVGRATYDIEEAMLSRLTVGFSIGEDSDVFYEMSLERQ